MSKHVSHSAVLRRYRLVIAGTLTLIALENILRVFEPLMLGLAIDGLLVGSRRELFLFVIVAGAGLVTGVARRLYDTRVYGRIFREICTETVARENQRDSPVSRISARTGFVAEFSEFFEYFLPAALTSILGLVGAVIMLFTLSATVGAVALLAGIFAGLVFYFTRRRVEMFNVGLNDQTEKQVDILATRNPLSIQEHFSSIVRWRILLSDLEAFNFGAIFAMTIGLSGFAAYQLIAIEQASEGTIFASLTYILQFSEAVIILPYTYQQFIRTKEIGQRLSAQTT